MKNPICLDILELTEADFPNLQSIDFDETGRRIEAVTLSGGDRRGPDYEANEALRNHPLNVGDEDLDEQECKAVFFFDVPQHLVPIVQSKDWELLRGTCEIQKGTENTQSIG